MRSTSSRNRAFTAAAPLESRRLLQAGFAVAGAALALRAAGLVDFEKGVNALPSLCLFHRLTGIDCPGCGMTRAFLRLAHGDLAGAWHLHPFSIPVLVTFVIMAFAPKTFLRNFNNSKIAKFIPPAALILLLTWWCYNKLPS